MATKDFKLAFRGPGGELPIQAEDEAALDLAMLIEAETSGRPLDDVLAEFGRCRSTYYEKRSRYLRAGVRGLLPRRPGPRGPWRRSPEVLRIIVTSRLEDPEISADAIVDELRARGHEVSVRSVERTLTQFGLSRGAAQRP